jgi:hypothetical protein
MWLRRSGLDGINGTADDYQVYMWAADLGSPSWKAAVAMGTATTNNTFWSWSTVQGGWVQGTPSTAVLDSASDTTADVAVTHTGAPTDISITGGSCTNLPCVTVPAAGAFVIHVTGAIDVFNGGGPGAQFYIGLKEDDNGGGYTVVRPCILQVGATSGRCTFSYTSTTATASHVYTYKLEMQASAAGLVYNHSFGVTGFPGDKVTLQVELSPKLGIPGN